MTELGLMKIFRRTVLSHIISILISVFVSGYRGKVVQICQSSPCHRTTIAHFLNAGKWDEELLRARLKDKIIEIVWEESMRSGKPIECIGDDTIFSKTKPALSAMHPIECAYFHYSHLKRQQDYGLQAVGILLACNGKTFLYDIILYDKTCSKIEILKNVAEELPVALNISYFLCDCWYSCPEIMEAFLKKGFYTIGAIKTNRVIFPRGIRIQIQQYAQYIRKGDPSVSLVTVAGRKYYVYRYEGNLSNVENAIVLICFPRNAFGNLHAMRAFISTDISLSSQEILNRYTHRWRIEVFFRQAKQKLSMDKFQIRSRVGIVRFCLLMSLAHFLCCTAVDSDSSFQAGYAFFQKHILTERITYIYNCGKCLEALDDLLSLIA